MIMEGIAKNKFLLGLEINEDREGSEENTMPRWLRKVTKLYNRMTTGDIEAIEEGLCSNGLLLIVDAIIYAAVYNVHDEETIWKLEELTKNEEELDMVPVSAYATAALHVIGANEYSGSDTVVEGIIKYMRTEAEQRRTM